MSANIGNHLPSVDLTRSVSLQDLQTDITSLRSELRSHSRSISDLRSNNLDLRSLGKCLGYIIVIGAAGYATYKSLNLSYKLGASEISCRMITERMLEQCTSKDKALTNLTHAFISNMNITPEAVPTLVSKIGNSLVEKGTSPEAIAVVLSSIPVIARESRQLSKCMSGCEIL